VTHNFGDARIEGIRQYVRDVIEAYDRTRETADQYNAAVNSLSEDNGRLGGENEALRRLTASLRADLEQMTAQRNAGRVWEARVKAADADRDRLAATVETLERQLREAGEGWDAASAELDRLREENEALRAENAVTEDEARDSIATAERVMVERDGLAAQVQQVRDLHPRDANPRHGCCYSAEPGHGHDPECRGRDHGLSRPAWPCRTIRALDAEQPGAGR
jgi:chromosome segregation ATPase